MFSKEKVEKVLNPPQKPMIRRKFREGLMDVLLRMEAKNPASMQAKVFAEKVESGKVSSLYGSHKPIAKREILPKPPPIKTSKN